MLPITSISQDHPHLDVSVHCLAPSSSLTSGACRCTPLFFPPLPMLSMDESPPDSPSMPWRPGSSAYPPPEPTQSSSSASTEESYQLRIQKLYDTLSEASYDLSLRDIVEPPFSIHGTIVPSQSRELLPSNSSKKSKGKLSQKQHCQNRSYSCRKSESKYVAPASPKCKLAFSFSYPRRDAANSVGPGALSSPASLMVQHQRVLSPTHENSVRTSSPRRLEHVLIQTPIATPTPTPTPSPPLPMALHNNSPLLDSPSKTSFKRSSSSHRTPVVKFKSHPERRNEHNPRGTFSVAGSSNRVHPSSQCSSCASYTIFFKSHCMVCGKLYCSNCAKGAMDIMSDGRKCKSPCKTRLGSKRFSKSIQSKCCWSMCGNVDVSSNPSKCKLSC